MSSILRVIASVGGNLPPYPNNYALFRSSLALPEKVVPQDEEMTAYVKKSRCLSAASLGILVSCLSSRLLQDRPRFLVTFVAMTKVTAQRARAILRNITMIGSTDINL